MLVYNVLIALFLAWLGMLRSIAGVLLWPVVVLHALTAVLLVVARRARQQNAASADVSG